MKKEGSYRFNLKFSCNSEKNIRAGELLERYANKKSILIIEALNEYMENHPEIMHDNCEIHIIKEKNNNILPDNWREIVKEMIKENVSAGNIQTGDIKNQDADKDTPVSEEGIAEMLNNIESFIV